MIRTAHVVPTTVVAALGPAVGLGAAREAMSSGNPLTIGIITAAAVVYIAVPAVLITVRNALPRAGALLAGSAAFACFAAFIVTGISAPLRDRITGMADALGPAQPVGVAAVLGLVAFSVVYPFVEARTRRD